MRLNGLSVLDVCAMLAILDLRVVVGVAPRVVVGLAARAELIVIIVGGS